MLRKLFKAAAPRPAKPKASLPAGQRVYAIGDIHGRLDLLRALVARIEADDSARTAAKTSLILLGDLVDRGPQSAQVIDYLRDLAASRAPGSTRFLLGNHEEVFLAALEDEKSLRFFTRIGGRETILSYGIDEDRYAALDYAELRDELRHRVPPEHVAFLNGFEDMIVLGDYVFVHAGIDPASPLAAQRPKNLRWIREEFLSHPGPLEKVVVHGHTIFDEVSYGTHRIGLDTGAYMTGNLTAMGFEGDTRWTLDTRA